MIDSHAHVSFEQFDHDRDDVIARAQAAGVTGWLEVGTDLKQSQLALKLARQHDQVYASCGVHPSDIQGLNDSNWVELEELATDDKIIAIGEVGLDFYRGGRLAEQLPILQKFIALAQEVDKPVIFHVRDGQESAHDALLEYLSGLAEVPTGVIHTYSGDADQARRYLELGLYLSFSGVITFKNAGEIIQVAQDVPVDRYLLETDCPFLAPMPHRGQRNEPAYVALVAETLANLRGATVTEIDQQSTTNFHKLFLQ